MEMRASVHLPASESTGYVRVELDGKTVGFLKADFYDVVCRSKATFQAAMNLPGAEEEAHSEDGRWVVRLRGEQALSALYLHLSQRDT